MTEPLNRSKPLLSMTAPVAGLSTAGVLTAAAHLKLATFALGAWTFPLAIVIPGVIGGRHIMHCHLFFKCLSQMSSHIRIRFKTDHFF